MVRVGNGAVQGGADKRIVRGWARVSDLPTAINIAKLRMSQPQIRNYSVILFRGGGRNHLQA
jgi:hypothetical protein